MGADRDDDLGRPALDQYGDADPRAAATWTTALPPDGDWVLFAGK